MSLLIGSESKLLFAMVLRFLLILPFVSFQPIVFTIVVQYLMLRFCGIVGEFVE
jgi:hypothetical protein